MYYILNTDNGLYLKRWGHWQNEDKMWGKKPRMFAEKGHIKLSIGQQVLLPYLWSLVPEEEKVTRRVAAINKRSYHVNFFSSDHYAMCDYWYEVRSKPLEELLPPHMQLRKVEL